MELRQLEHFRLLAEELHFTRAARRAHVVQSTLSSSIRALERELGEPLFTRGGRRVDLTEAGRALVPAARRALAAAEEGRDAVAAVRGLLRGQLTLGLTQSTLTLIDPPDLLARYHRRHPGVRIRARNNAVPALVSATVAGELDLAFVDRPLGPDGHRVHERYLRSDPLVLMVPRGDPLSRRRAVRLAELADRDFVEFRADSALRASIDAACAAAGLRRRICCELDTVADLIDLIGHGMGVSLLPPWPLRLAGDRVVPVPVDPPIPRDLVVVTPADRPPSPAAAALLAMLG